MSRASAEAITNVQTGDAAQLPEWDASRLHNGQSVAVPMPPRRRKVLFGVAAIGVLVVAASVTLGAAFDGYRIPTESMSPTLQRGDRVLARGISGESASPGDVVIFQIPTGVERVSRVVAVEGDRITTEDGLLVVNGVQAVEPYLPEGIVTANLTPTTVPAGHLFVLSDNRANAQDSRVLGPIPYEDVYARVSFLWWPLDAVGGI